MLGLDSATTVALIFGGCCANVFALEAIVRTESSSGLLITFFQFFLTALAAYPSQFSVDGKYTLRNPQIPIRRWAVIGAMHFGINMLNNWAFAYNISVPVHIILRSFGSVTTMIAGFVRGKRYSFLQVLSVILLTVGVLVSAWADAESKGMSMSMEQGSYGSEFAKGLGVLIIAQFLSATMGVYHQDTYAMYGANWQESLFYTHFLCLPLFLPISSILQQQYGRLTKTPPLTTGELLYFWKHFLPGSPGEQTISLMQASIERLPRGILFIGINAVTQLACIAGVNLLCANASAVTVTIVLNIRKLVSFILSTILFGHYMSNMMIFGAVLVFGSGALYGWETSWRVPQQKKLQNQTNGHLKKEK